MMKMFPFLTLLCALAQPAVASQTAWVTTDGGAMRLVISDDGKSPARGVLEIKLNDGWKTYWREPGDGGIPPSLNGGGANVELLFPAPERIDENGQVFSGYHTGVSLPFVLPESLLNGDKLTAFIGICSEICVPFQADFAVVRDNGDADFVTSAFSNLPKFAGENAGITQVSRLNDQLVLTAEDGARDLFLAPETGLYLANPKMDGAAFSVRILKEKQAGVKVHYTLSTSNGAVSGTFQMPK